MNVIQYTERPQPRFMPRTTGALNHDHQEKRRALARRVLHAVLERGSAISMNELASDAGCSIPTLKHYFADRAGAVAEGFRTVREDAATYIDTIASPAELSVEASLAKVANDLTTAWQRFGVGKVFAVGMAAGLLDAQIGPAYLDGLLEPTVIAMEARLRAHAERGELSIDARDQLAVRTASLAFISPLLVVLLHQHALEGARCRPLDVPAFVREHVSRFLLGHGRRGRRRIESASRGAGKGRPRAK